MKHILAVTSLATFLAALLSTPVLGQMQEGKPDASAAPTTGKARAAAQRTRMGSDARHCLKFATNMEIHRCAEKYRPR